MPPFGSATYSDYELAAAPALPPILPATAPYPHVPHYPRLYPVVCVPSAGGIPSDLALSIPKIARRNIAPAKQNDAYDLGLALARAMYGDDGASARTKLDGLLTKLRHKVEEARAKKRHERSPQVCKIGPKDAVATANELPVEFPPGESFEGLLKVLHEARGPVARLTTAGAITPDGRLDLCKQVVRPRFSDLVDAVSAAAPGVVSHFLVGNNVIFKRLGANATSNMHEDGSVVAGADTVEAEVVADVKAEVEVEAMAEADAEAEVDTEPEPLSPRSKVVSDHLVAFEQLAASAQPIRTFYLAGNGIGAAASPHIANALRHARSLESLWLKMNPIGTGAYHFGSLVASSPKLVLLDLFNTGD